MTVSEQILHLLTDKPMTGEELEAALGMPHQTVSASLTGLLKGGLVQRTGEMRPTARGRAAHVLRKTPKAAGMVWKTLRCECGFAAAEPQFIHTAMFGVACPRCGKSVAA
jgi:predicted ArsR family transcriptional regulator